MTVSYQYEVASSTSGGFTKLLFMWRGSLYKLIYRELILFLIFFGIISVVYRHALSLNQKRIFEQIVLYCDTFMSLIPLSFVLGFYVAYVANRWWQQYIAIPWPDKVMHLIALYVTGNDDYGRMLRRSLMRYLNLSLILVLRSISSAVKRRLPTLDHVVESGFMTTIELELFQSVPSVEFNTYWIPCTWFINLLKEARRTHRIDDTQGLKIIMEEFNDFRSKCGLLWSYDWVSIPLVYTQVVTLATYSFFVVALIGRQFIEGNAKSFQMALDTYLPLFTILEFFFYMGLLKVAEQLINPFGDDDEDFELNWLIDRHTKVSYLGVDTLMARCPPLVKDIYFDSENLILPYTEAAASYKRKTYRGSVANMTVPEEKQAMFLPDIIEEDDEESVRGTATPRTSTASLATHANESPIITRRQISGSPSTTRRMSAQNNPETNIQMDIQDSLIDSENAAKKSNILKSLPWIELNRKSFLPSNPQKVTSINLRPWPSATNLEESTLANDDQSTSFHEHKMTPPTSDKTSKEKPFFYISSPPPCITICHEPETAPPDISFKGFFNSGFSQENLTNVGNKNSEVKEGIIHDKPAKASFIKRQSSFQSTVKPKRKSSRWKWKFDSNVGQFRRKTINTSSNNPRLAKKVISQCRSTPNLKSLTSSSSLPSKDINLPVRAASEDKDDRSNL